MEDEASIALMQKGRLEGCGYIVTTVGTGEKAVALASSGESIDLMLMDIDLGKGMDGTETASIIAKARDIPVIFLSSHARSEVVVKGEKIASYGYVVKSSSITALDASIKTAFKLFEAKGR